MVFEKRENPFKRTGYLNPTPITFFHLIHIPRGSNPSPILFLWKRNPSDNFLEKNRRKLARRLQGEKGSDQLYK